MNTRGTREVTREYKGHVRWIHAKKMYDGAHTGGTDDEGHIHEVRDTREMSEGRGKRRGTTNEGDEGHLSRTVARGTREGTRRDTYEG